MMYLICVLIKNTCCTCLPFNLYSARLVKKKNFYFEMRITSFFASVRMRNVNPEVTATCVVTSVHSLLTLEDHAVCEDVVYGSQVCPEHLQVRGFMYTSRKNVTLCCFSSV